MRHGIRRRSQLQKSLLLREKALIELAAVHMSLYVVRAFRTVGLAI
jgi:hypothetical protein